MAMVDRRVPLDAMFIRARGRHVDLVLHGGGPEVDRELVRELEAVGDLLAVHDDRYAGIVEAGIDRKLDDSSVIVAIGLLATAQDELRVSVRRGDEK